MRYYILVISITVVGFFFPSEFLGFTGSLLVKLALLFLIGFISYKHLKTPVTTQPDDKPIKKTVEDNLTSGKQTEWEHIPVTSSDSGSLVGLLNDKELSLSALLLSQFDILYSFLLPTNGYIFVEESNNPSRLLFKKNKNDIEWQDSNQVPQVIGLLKNHTSEVLVENHLADGSSILPYYNSAVYSPGSVLAFYTMLSDSQKIYWVFDSPATGYFNEEDFSVLKQVSFTVHYSIGIAYKQSLIKKERITESKKLQLAQKLNTSASLDEMATDFVEFLATIFEAHKLTIALIDANNTQMATVLKTIGMVDSVKSGSRFYLSEGLCGKVLTNKQVYLLDDIERDGYFIPRFSKTEKTNYGLRSFLGIPLNIKSDVMGLVVMEHKNVAAFSADIKKELLSYTEQFSSAMQRVLEASILEENDEI